MHYSESDISDVYGGEFGLYSKMCYCTKIIIDTVIILTSLYVNSMKIKNTQIVLKMGKPSKKSGGQRYKMSKKPDVLKLGSSLHNSNLNFVPRMFLMS